MQWVSLWHMVPLSAGGLIRKGRIGRQLRVKHWDYFLPTWSTQRLWSTLPPGFGFGSAVAEIQLSSCSVQVHHRWANVPVVPQIRTECWLSLKMVQNHLGYLENCSIYNLCLNPAGIPDVYVFANVFYCCVYLQQEGRKHFCMEYSFDVSNGPISCGLSNLKLFFH